MSRLFCIFVGMTERIQKKETRIRSLDIFRGFTVAKALNTVTGTYDPNFWDGNSLHKDGLGTLIYFSGEFKRELIVRLHDSLAEGGVLFTGSYVLSGLYEDLFDEKHYHNLTYYTKKAVKK